MWEWLVSKPKVEIRKNVKKVDSKMGYPHQIQGYIDFFEKYDEIFMNF